MKTLTLAVSLLLTMLSAGAGISSGWSSGPLIVVAVAEPRTVPVSLVIPAEFVSVPIRVTSDQKNTALAYEESRQAIELITKKAKDGGRFRTSMGVVSLSQRQGGFGISSGSWNQPAATAEIHLLVPLAKEGDNLFGAGAEAARFVEALSLPGKAHLELGVLQLAVENPEQHRTQLLGLLAAEIRKTREAMAAQGNVRVEGLEGPVLVRRLDERNVELFLGYKLSFTLDK